MAIRNNTYFVSLFLVMSLLVVFGLSGCNATKGPAKVTLDNGQAAFKVKGKVRTISRNKDMLTIKPPSSKEISFNLNDATVYQNAKSVHEIERDMGVIVTYTTDEKGNHAVVVQKLPDGSCG